MAEPRSKLLELPDEFINGLRELMERWDNRFTLQGKSIAEQYLKGKISVILELGFASTCPCLTSSARTVGPRSKKCEAASTFSGPILQFGSCAREPDNWNKESMFISDVQSVQGPTGTGTIPSWMGL